MFTKPKRRVQRVFIHCSASDHAHHDHVDVMRKWHVEGNGWSDVGYHYFIRKNGALQIGRPIERSPAAQAKHNTGTIAICLHGLDVDKFTPAQFTTLQTLCRKIHAALPEATFHGHREVAAKTCPVFDYAKVLGLNSAGRMVFDLPDYSAPEPTPKRDAGVAAVGAGGAAVVVVETARMGHHWVAVAVAVLAAAGIGFLIWKRRTR